MNKLEKFGLITGITGLFSDTIALTTFFSGFWGTPTSTTAVVSAQAAGSSSPMAFVVNSTDIPLIARIIIFLTLIYSWAAISWVMARRSFDGRKYRTPDVVKDILYRSVWGFGILVLPIFSMLLITFWQSDLPSRADAMKVYAQRTTVINSQAATTTIASDGFSGEDGIYDKTDASNWAIFWSLPLQAAQGGLLYYVFILLMPVVYPEMADSELEFEKALIKNEEEEPSKIVNLSERQISQQVAKK